MTANGATPGGVPPAHDGTGAAAHRTPLIAFDPRLGPAAAAADPLSADAQQRIRERAAQVLARYPRPRSALMPLLYLVQAEQGYVSADGIRLVADILGLTTAEVTAVATFYTMYRRRPCGRYLVGVCTNTLCAILGGDAIFDALREHLGIENGETTPDGAVTLEHIECNAACDYAPVVMVNWEFFDNQTPASARELVDRLRAGDPPMPTRGAPLRTFTEISQLLAGFPDDLADAGPSAGPASLAGLELARSRGEAAPPFPTENAPREEGA
ncbi:NADH dehydrogenase subunit E [Acidothermus cellulolyticus 11B]|jgi:NADH-quinone oxidoreductase subunit E|uniref:NADH dehydrogenase subunit E n=1 Tax=Acidothermus cellulolyticus (strain ATCC 43068 / DSM 8971 / 11B) TaxID=351607 RepID=A0LRI5_ACIC1|nr:NADH-quinone oxidoreductase subunit NuoE [Acidothermus cellulolyticus]ABK52045.1 NADH dehydrogenase subunit E [Acidothermus cellulolyticus 11B]